MSVRPRQRNFGSGDEPRHVAEATVTVEAEEVKFKISLKLKVVQAE